MTRPGGTPLLAVALVFLFSTGGADVLARYRCAHHDGASSPTERPRTARSAERSGHDHAPEVQTGSAHSDGHEGHGPCTCAGQCTLGCAGMVALGSASAAAVEGAGPLRWSPGPRTEAIRPPLPYLHPFPNPPPVPA